MPKKVGEAGLRALITKIKEALPVPFTSSFEDQKPGLVPYSASRPEGSYLNASGTFTVPSPYDDSKVRADIATLQDALEAEEAAREAVDDVLASSIDTHESDTSNPHSVTAAQIGLGNVDNTADADKVVRAVAVQAGEYDDANLYVETGVYSLYGRDIQHAPGGTPIMTALLYVDVVENNGMFLVFQRWEPETEYSGGFGCVTNYRTAYGSSLSSLTWKPWQQVWTDEYHAAHSHAASEITSGTLPIARGGTGATTAKDALVNLGLVFGANETYEIYGLFAGHITNGKTEVHCLVHLPKLTTGRTVTVTASAGWIRGISGYVDGTNYLADLYSLYTTTVLKRGDRAVEVTYKKDSTFNDVTNNTPVTVAAYITFKFT